MRYLSISLSFLLFYSSPAAADQHVRTIDPPATATLGEAIERSPAVRQLIDQLEAANVIVHIQSCQDLPLGIGGTTRLIANRGGFRFIRISLATQLRGADRIAILGHELHHAWEIAQSDAGDAHGLEQLLEATGYRMRGRYFETRNALRVERTVRDELRNWRAALETQPVVELHHQDLGARGSKAAAEVPKR